MKQFIIIVISLIMFFSAGIQLEYNNNITLPEWVEELVCKDKGSCVNMTNTLTYKIAENYFFIHK